jgi:transcriptional regulator with XRE-family HTH domain
MVFIQENYMFKIGPVIKNIREGRRIEQITLAKMLPIARNSLSQIESGIRRPTPNVLAAILSIFDQDSRKLSDSEVISIVMAVLEDSIAGFNLSINLESRITTDPIRPDFLMRLPSGRVNSGDIRRHSTKTMRSDILEVIEAISNNKTLRNACIFLAKDESAVELIPIISQNKRMQKLLKKITSVNAPILKLVETVIDSKDMLPNDKLEVLHSVINGLTKQHRKQ